MRTFLGIAPPEGVAERLFANRAALRNAWKGVRWVESGDYHITLVFFGEREPVVVESLISSIAATARFFPSFDITIAGIGCFGPPARPKIIIENVAAGREGLQNLRRILRPAVEPLTGWENRPFRPHITLGRTGRSSSGPAGGGLLPPDVKLDTVETFRADEVVLFQSEPRQYGARYTRLETWPLKESI